MIEVMPNFHNLSRHADPDVLQPIDPNHDRSDLTRSSGCVGTSLRVLESVFPKICPSQSLSPSHAIV